MKLPENKSATLREAFHEFHGGIRTDGSGMNQTKDSDHFFKCHDVAHVVFGCDTSFRGEGLVKLWTIFGTTLGFANHVKGYADANAFELFKKYRLMHVLSHSVKLIALAPVVIFRARKMTKKWPWDAYEDYLDVPLSEIRSEFNIVPVGN